MKTRNLSCTTFCSVVAAAAIYGWVGTATAEEEIIGTRDLSESERLTARLPDVSSIKLKVHYVDNSGTIKLDDQTLFHKTTRGDPDLGFEMLLTDKLPKGQHKFTIVVTNQRGDDDGQNGGRCNSSDIENGTHRAHVEAHVVLTTKDGIARDLCTWSRYSRCAPAGVFFQDECAVQINE